MCAMPASPAVKEYCRCLMALLPIGKVGSFFISSIAKMLIFSKPFVNSVNLFFFYIKIYKKKI